MGQSFSDKIAGSSVPISGLDPFFVKGVSPSMRAVEVAIQELAQSEVSVLLLGETGAGKRTIARRIHDISRHSKQPFTVVRCLHLAGDELETGKPGLFGQGTVFLEEIGDLNLSLQGRLLEWLSKSADNGHAGMKARLICGSSRDLEAEVRSGKFREDLYYRMSGVCLRLPPLRQRKEDIPFLMSSYLSKYAEDFSRPVPVTERQTHQLFHDYGWPGNIRELEDAVKAHGRTGR